MRVRVLSGSVAGSALAAVLWILAHAPAIPPPHAAPPPLPARPTSASPVPSASPPLVGTAVQATTPTPTPHTGHLLGYLAPGSTGPDVLRLQQLLFAQGKTYLTPDAVYGPTTERAVREVQQERTIHADPPGVYGPATRAALGAAPL